VAIGGNEAIVGAYCEAFGATPCTGPGSVEVFRRSPLNTWIAIQRLTAPDGVNGEGFGSSVALAGANNRNVVAGAFRASSPTNAGALYILSGDQLFANGFE
jgi:FG-GAP repeat